MTVPPPPPALSQGWALASVILKLLEMRLLQKTLRGCNGPVARIMGNKPKRKTQLSRESNLDHLHGRSAPLHHAAKDNVR